MAAKFFPLDRCNQIVVHKSHQPDAIIDLLDTDGLTRQRSAGPGKYPSTFFSASSPECRPALHLLQLCHSDPALDCVCLWIGLVGSAICSMLLVSDLGRLSRFLNMLRVFKLQSAMSMEAWILVAFSGCVFLGVLGIELVIRGFANPLTLSMLWAGEASGALTGLLLASHTGVLIGATAITVWSENRKLLPVHFLTSGLGSASGVLELAGFLIPATQILGFAAAGIETAIGTLIELRKDPADAPLRHGKSGLLLRISGVVEGPMALLLRIFAGSMSAGRYAAAGCFLLAALLSRYGWIWAGRVSARDPHALFHLQRKRK